MVLFGTREIKRLIDEALVNPDLIANWKRSEIFTPNSIKAAL